MDQARQAPATDRAPDAVAATVFRPPDQRPIHDDARAAALGIVRYESPRLVLYTDVPAEQVQSIPALVDQLYPVWEEFLGPLPPDPNGAPFQMTGYLIRERDRFEAAGMLPEEQLGFQHGKHRGAEFWVEDQPFDYYRRHLVLHEATHCYMTIVPGPRPPLWCLEGLAELFAVHRLDEDGRAEFAISPASAEDVPGFGRIALIQKACAAGEGLSLRQVMELGPREFADPSSGPYAWSWALCLFLDRHPRSRDRFRAACLRCASGDFLAVLEQSFQADAAALWVDWEQFSRHLEFGYDFDRAAIDYRAGRPLAAGESRSFDVQADRGWQSTEVLLDAAAVYSLRAEGRVELASAPRPWLSEPAGITIRYVDGRPIGRLLGAVQSADPPTLDGDGSLLRVLDLGDPAAREPQTGIETPAAVGDRASADVEFQSKVDGTLYLRVNDAWSELADNAGAYRVTVTRQP